MSDWHNTILTGDVHDRLADLPDSSIHCVMTSPPYYGLRDYSADGQIGLEDSLDEYIQELVAVGRELRRVLRPDGAWWLNLGDSYCTRRRARQSASEQSIANSSVGRDNGDYSPSGDESAKYHNASLQDHGHNFVDKDKMLVPHRTAIALQDDGWVVRNDVTWVKPNPMPQSVKDRLNTTTEQIFLLTPEPDYWFDLDAIREPYSEDTLRESKYNWQGNTEKTGKDARRDAGVQNVGGSGMGSPEKQRDDLLHPAGKNPGDVFEVTTKPFPDAHFAVYPPELCEKPIKATAPPTVCAECGAPYERVAVEDNTIPMPDTNRKQGRRALELFENSELSHQHIRAMRAVGFTDAGQAQEVYDGHGNNTKAVERLATEAKDVLGGYAREFLGDKRTDTKWVQGCDCDTDATEPGIVLDPFAGAGTTLLKAKELGRRFVGIELNPEYADMARARVGLTPQDPSRVRDDDAQQGLETYTDGGEADE